VQKTFDGVPKLSYLFFVIKFLNLRLSLLALLYSRAAVEV